VTGVRVANPFLEHSLRRYAFAWDALAGRTGRHLDVGCGKGEFVGVLFATTALDCYGADPTLIICWTLTTPSSGSRGCTAWSTRPASGLTPIGGASSTCPTSSAGTCR
jgi:hypothetical protein